MADGLFYNDTREPFWSVDPTAVTLSTTAKALYPAGAFPTLGTQYFTRPGKKLRIRLHGRATTAATPGNGSFNVYYGSGADATGTLIMTGTPVAMVANGSNLPWMCDLNVVCRLTGASGSLMCTGVSHFNVGLILSTLQPIFLPVAPAPVSVDLTAVGIISVQFLRSGSTAETMQVHDLEVVSMN